MRRDPKDTATMSISRRVVVLATVALAAVVLGGLSAGLGTAEAGTPCGGPSPQVGDWVTAQSGSWTGSTTWLRHDGDDFVPGGSPTDTNTSPMTICAGHFVTVPSGTYGGPLTIASGATLEINNNHDITLTGDVVVEGVLQGRFDRGVARFTGSSVRNDGTVKPKEVRFEGTSQRLAGSGTWTGGAMHVTTGTTLALDSDVTVQVALSAATGSRIEVNGHDLTVAEDTVNDAFFNDGTVVGPGAVSMRGPASGNIALNPNGGQTGSPATGVWQVPLHVEAGTVRVNTSTLEAPVAVDADATFEIANDRTITLQGDLVVDGTLSGEFDRGLLAVETGRITNNGTIRPETIELRTTTTVEGHGAWTGAGSFRIVTGADVTLGNDLVLPLLVDARTGAHLRLDGHDLTVVEDTVNDGFLNDGTVEGGTVRLRGPESGTMSFNPNGGQTGSPATGMWQAPVVIETGTVRTHTSTLGSALTVDAGATFEIANDRTITVEGDLVVGGTVSGEFDRGLLALEGDQVTNDGTVRPETVELRGTATLDGAGAWTGSALVLADGSTTTLGSDVTAAVTTTVEGGAGLVLPSPHTLAYTAGAFVAAPGSRISGGGALDVAAIAADLDGAIAPGASPGILTYVGDHQHESATLEVELDSSTTPGSGHDQLAVTGSADLTDGSVQVTVTDGYEPGLGDEYVVMTCTDGCTGTLDPITVLTEGYAFDTVHRSNEVAIVVTATPEVCDGVDNDGDGDTDEGFTDTDGDGDADCVDTDDDDDGQSDDDEVACGSDPLDASSTSPDVDEDGIVDCLDDDIQQPPVAADDGYTIDQGTTLEVEAPGVLGNDTDPNDDPLTAVLDTDVDDGTLTLAPDGSLTYEPDDEFAGEDSFTYLADDGTAASAPATVRITVAAVEPPPPAEATCLGHPATIVGTEGDDVILGTGGNDVIAGLGGNDRIDGLGGSDLICGGDGADEIDGGGGHDLLHGGNGNDLLEAGRGFDLLYGGGGDDRMDGGRGLDLGIGGSGQDHCTNIELRLSCERHRPGGRWWW